MMKKIISTLLSLSLFIGVISCDNATNVSEGYIEDIFTVKSNSQGWLIQPELSDTTYFVRSLSGLDLQDGDRGVMRVSYKFDNGYGPATATWSIDNVIDIITPHALTPKNNVDTVKYDSHIEGIDYYYAYSPVWLWDKKQNINVVYQGSEASFVMSPAGFDNKILQLELRADVKGGEEYKSEMLTYDLSNIASMLGEDDKSTLRQLDTLRTNIKVKYYNSETNTIIEGNINGGSCVNPFKK